MIVLETHPQGGAATNGVRGAPSRADKEALGTFCDGHCFPSRDA